jgi:hypothetical protein
VLLRLPEARAARHRFVRASKPREPQQRRSRLCEIAVPRKAGGRPLPLDRAPTERHGSPRYGVPRPARPVWKHRRGTSRYRWTRGTDHGVGSHPPVLRCLWQAHGVVQQRPISNLPGLQTAAIPTARTRHDRRCRTRRRDPPGPVTALPDGDLQRSCRLRRARRERRRGGRPRSHGRVGHSSQGRQLLR